MAFIGYTKLTRTCVRRGGYEPIRYIMLIISFIFSLPIPVLKNFSFNNASDFE